MFTTTQTLFPIHMYKPQAYNDSVNLILETNHQVNNTNTVKLDILIPTN